jgi:hypothetical protein
MLALLGLLAVAGYQNRDRIKEVLGNLGQGGLNSSFVVNPSGQITLPLVTHVAFQPSYIWEHNRVPGLRDFNYLQFGLIVSTR